MMTNLSKAIEYAYATHFHQKRMNNGEPYICHPIRVLHIIQEQEASLGRLLGKNNETMCCAAILHDVIEDQNTDEYSISYNFGNEVLTLVKELTKPSSKMPKDTDPKIKQEADFLHMKRMSKDAKIIKMADRIDNLRDIEKMRWSFMAKYLNESKVLLAICKDASPELSEKLSDLIKQKEGMLEELSWRKV